MAQREAAKRAQLAKERAAALVNNFCTCIHVK